MAADNLAVKGQRRRSVVSNASETTNVYRRNPSEARPTNGKGTLSAVKISEKIDEELKKDGVKQRDARRREVKVVLLGQAESGKSTLQKQFQLHYAARTLDVERLSWVPVVYLNIIKAVRMLLTDVDHETTTTPLEEPEISQAAKQDLDELRMRLLPLLALENTLASELSGGVSISGGRPAAYVRSGWQRLIVPPWSSSDSNKKANAGILRTRDMTVLVARTLTLATDDIDALWAHDAIRFYFRERKIRLEDSAAYFLNHIQRIGEPEYSPTNDDILHVRLQTLGVMEHTFPINLTGKTYDWKLYDVGGARGHRHKWAPYFDDATAIIFLAPISAFDQYLEEDPRTNRIDDSLQLWSSICSNQLLKGAHLVLLLNKTDLLREKLDAGTYVRKYITSFGDRPNNFETVADYFRSHFLQVHRRKDPSKRNLHVHFTSMLDTKAMQSILSIVAEAIVRKHIAEIGIL